jgi:hypothetical protein
LRSGVMSDERLHSVAEDALEQLSPELALVDADLARLARSRLPDYPALPAALARADDGHPAPDPGSLRAAIAARGPSPPAERTVVEGPRPTTPRAIVVAAGARPHVAKTAAMTADRDETGRTLGAEEPGDRGRGRLRRYSTAAALVVLSLLGFVIAAAKLTGENDAATSAPPPAASARAVPAEGESQEGKTGTARATAPAAPAATTPPTSRPAAKKDGASGQAGGLRTPGHTFVWLPVREANHYKVEFFRGTKKIFEARPSRARLELPERWTFKGRRYTLTSGRYRWSVRPGFGPRTKARYGRAIVSSVGTLPE